MHVPLGSVSWSSLFDLPPLLVPVPSKLIWTKYIRMDMNVFSPTGT